MSSSFNEFSALLAEKLDTYDKTGAEAVCDELVNYLYSSEEAVSAIDAGKAMQGLRNKRMFLAMQRLGDALIQTGRQTYKIRRLYAQALIDQNNLTAAISILNELKSDTANASAEDREATKENIEGRGLIGRTYKQLYVNAKNPGNAQNVFFIKQSMKAYLDVYTSSPLDYTWHGINVVALLKRAQFDNIDLTGFPDAEALAASILQTMEDKYAEQRADAWDFATAAEACVALRKPVDALKWMSGYARMPYADAFELASTLRQMEEVWQLDMSSETGKLLLPILRAELLKREGGNFVIDVQELQQQKATQKSTTNKFENLAKETGETSMNLEKVFGDDSFQTYQWYMKGADRCLAVARIGTDSSKGFGTGFLLKGEVLHEKLTSELVLLTNAHVISEDPKENSLRPDEAIVIFELLNREQEFKVAEILWSSPIVDMDVTIIRFHEKDLARLTELTKTINFYPVAPRLPVVDKGKLTQRVYIIGHPFGGTLQLSFQDNLLLDHQDPRIHYRTPTAGGSSGSPIFNQQWELIGIHHAGNKQMRKLNNEEGIYEANEGMWIQSVKKAVNASAEVQKKLSTNLTQTG